MFIEDNEFLSFLPDFCFSLISSLRYVVRDPSFKGYHEAELQK